MNYSREVENMCVVTKGPHHDPAPIPEEGKWIASKQITDISGYTHGVGWCAPQQGACKLSLNVKNGTHLVHPEELEPALRIVDVLHAGETNGLMEQPRKELAPERHAGTAITTAAHDPRLGIRGELGELAQRRGKIDIAHQHPRALRRTGTAPNGKPLPPIDFVTQHDNLRRGL